MHCHPPGFVFFFSIAKLLGPFGCHCLAGSKGESWDWDKKCRCSLPETNSDFAMHLEIGRLTAPKGNEKVFQTSIFRCELLVLGRVDGDDDDDDGDDDDDDGGGDDDDDDDHEYRYYCHCYSLLVNVISIILKYHYYHLVINTTFMGCSSSQ